MICFLALVTEATASYSFITLGDWGGKALGSYQSQTVSAVAEQMGKTAADNKIKFVVNTGDNFYYCGLQNTSDFQIAETTRRYTLLQASRCLGILRLATMSMDTMWKPRYS